MKKSLILAAVAALALTLVGCKKEETLGDKLDKAGKEVNKEAADLQKKLDKALNE